MSNVAKTYIQAGFETTARTAVAATKKIYALGGVPTESRPKEYVDQSRASHTAHYDAVETNVVVDGWGLELPALSFTDLAWWGELLWAGGVSPTGAGPYTRTYDDSDGSPKTATFEVADNVGAFRVPGVVNKSWELSGKSKGMVGLKMDFMAERVTPAHTMTGSLTDRDLRGSYMAFKDTALYIDDAAGGIGGTQVAASLSEFSLKMDNALEADFLGNSDYMGVHEFGERYLEFMAVLVFNATSYAEFQNKFQTNTGRFIRLRNTGSGNFQFTCDLYSKLETFEFKPEGNIRKVALMGRSLYDPTLGFDWQMSLINDLSAIQYHDI